MTMDRVGGRRGKKKGRRDGGAELAGMWWNWRESTARGMFSWSGLHLDWWGGWVVYMTARSTADTVGM